MKGDKQNSESRAVDGQKTRKKGVIPRQGVPVYQYVDRGENGHNQCVGKPFVFNHQGERIELI